jgi:hypothetical protein
MKLPSRCYSSFFRLITLLFLLVYPTSGAAEPLKNKPSAPDLLEDPSTIPYKGEVFQKLLRATGLKPSSDLAEIVAQTQGKIAGRQGWLRKGERQDKQEGNDGKTPFQNAEISALLAQLNLTAAVLPHKKHYDAALLLGAMANTMEVRSNFFTDLVDTKALACPQVYWLVGDRPLDPNNEAAAIKILQDNHTSLTETSIAAYFNSEKLAYLQKKGLLKASRILPTGMVPVETSPGLYRRPNTADTFKIFFEHLASKRISLPAKPHILVISNQPFVEYQRQVALTFLPPGEFTVEAVGPEATSSRENILLLDTLARTLYQYEQRIGAK